MEDTGIKGGGGTEKEKAETGEAAHVQRTFMRTEHPEGIFAFFGEWWGMSCS